MSKDSKSQGFPDVNTKLAAPVKKSVFERQKEQAEAKRLQEQRETAAVYEDFVKSFDDDGSDNESGLPGLGVDPSRGTSLGSSLSRRHFTSNMSGPGRGSKISGPGSLGPAPAAFSRKRTYEGSTPSNTRAFGEATNEPSKAFNASDDEDETITSRAEERAKQKPTIHMSSLPPGMSVAAIRAVLPSSLTVDGVRILPLTGGNGERRSMSAIVTLAAETPASDLDTAVNSLQNRYLGRGFYLSLSRHLSSAVITSSIPGHTTSRLPFGAKAAPQAMGRGQLPMRGRGGFAPPPSLMHRPGPFHRAPPEVQVNVVPPTDLKQLKMIHKMLELLLVNGSEFEALLMSRPEVQNEERWAWLWDPTSTGGIWYRWRLWDILTRGTQHTTSKSDDSIQYIFENSAPWIAADASLPFEYTTELSGFISDPDYNSSEDEDSGDEGRKRLQHLQGGAAHTEASADDGPSYLNPLRKAKLVHLLSRIPDSTAKLRRGDVARVTAFAIQHAGSGAEEVVELLTANIHSPFAKDATKRESPGRELQEPLPTAENKPGDDVDPSALKLIALYLVSDILSSSSTSGVRHAWRYRQLFESSLRRKKTFEELGRLEKQLKWGRLRAEKWRRAVGVILNIWEGWSVFTAAGQEDFVETFQNPPLTAVEREQAEKAAAEAQRAEKAKSKWRIVPEHSENNLGSEMEAGDVDGEPMEEDEDIDGVPMEDSDEEMNDQSIEDNGDSHEPETTEVESLVDKPSEELEDTSATSASKKQRPRAADMFGDSDGE